MRGGGGFGRSMATWIVLSGDLKANSRISRRKPYQMKSKITDTCTGVSERSKRQSIPFGKDFRVVVPVSGRE